MDPSSLPLDWTRVSRKRAFTTNGTSCCTGGACRHGRRGSSSTPNSENSTTGNNDNQASTTRLYRGQVIVCLTDSNPEWFQAYLFLQDEDTTWGLLGVQQEIDECLQCSQGGYRVITLRVTTTTTTDQVTFPNVEWTGGDMMDLNGPGIVMQARKIMTGAHAVPVLEGVFSGIVRQVQASLNDDNDEHPWDPLQVFPELTIVVGSMELRLPDTVLCR